MLWLIGNTLHASSLYNDSVLVKADSVTAKFEALSAQSVDSLDSTQYVDTTNTFKPNPIKAVWLGAIIPGYGQIVNRSYWKLPIVYAGFLGCTYAITLNSTRYETYKKAYFDKIDSNPNTNSFLQFPNGDKLSEQVLKSAYDQYRRYRDMSIFITVGFYAITLIEAYVDAQLFDFDITPDLSMHIRPALLQNEYGQSNKAGLQFSINLK